MKNLLFSSVFAIMFLTACNSTPANHNESREVSSPRKLASDVNQASIDSVTQFMLTASASDFHTNRPPEAVRFRNVQLGYMTVSNGQKQYVMCGQFLASMKNNKENWTPFATIKTSGYEQWNGAQATVFCQDSSITWGNTNDLSSSLQRQMDSLR